MLKTPAQDESICAKKLKLGPSSSKTVRDEKIGLKPINETTTSEVIKQEEIYELDENEQSGSDTHNDGDVDCEYERNITKAEKGKANDSVSFSCNICQYRTTKNFLLSRHLKTHSDDLPHKCSVCERGFKTNSSLMNHRNTHLGIKPHSCQDCDMAFGTYGELLRHVQYKHTHEKPHKCTECDYSAVESSKLRRHMRSHTGERPYKCPHCTYAFSDTFKLKRHMRVHTGEKPYECDICKARFSQSNSLKHHRPIHSVNKPVLQCHLCPTTCCNTKNLRAHINRLHKSEQPLHCKHCGKEFPDRYSYEMHIKTHEGEKHIGGTVKDENVVLKPMDETTISELSKQDKILESDEKEQKASDKHDDGDVNCEYKRKNKKVEKSTASETASLSHTDERPYKCTVCGRGFKRNFTLMNHQNTHLGLKPHACKDCDMAFGTYGEMVRHVQYKHTHEKPHKCTECDYSTVELSKLRRHMRCHTGERPYKCPHCTFAFSDAFKLKRHVRVHTGEKPYECDICEARFTQSNSLKNHRLIHSVNKPAFQCHLCPITCSNKANLRVHIKKFHKSIQPQPIEPDNSSSEMHIKTHEGEKYFRCEYCPYASISKRQLDSHVLLHLNAKSFECEVCKTTFRQKAQLSRHIKVHHSDNYEEGKVQDEKSRNEMYDEETPYNEGNIQYVYNELEEYDEENESNDSGDEENDEQEQEAEIKRKNIIDVKMEKVETVVVETPLPVLNHSINVKSENEHETFSLELKNDQDEKSQKMCDEEAEYNKDNIKYVHRKICTKESNKAYEEECDEQKQKLEIKRKNIVDIKVEKDETVVEISQPLLNHSVNVKSENDGLGFMVIKVMPDEDEKGGKINKSNKKNY